MEEADQQDTSEYETLKDEYRESVLEFETLQKSLQEQNLKLQEHKALIDNQESEETPLEELYLYIQSLKDENEIILRQIEKKDELIIKCRESREKISSSQDDISISESPQRHTQKLDVSLLNHTPEKNQQIVQIESHRHQMSPEAKSILNQQEEMINDLEKQLKALLDGGDDETVMDHLNMIERKVSQQSLQTTPTKAKKEGYLIKQGLRIKNWKQRFFYISKDMLYYTKKKETRYTTLGGIDLKDITVKKQDLEEFPNLLTISTPTRDWYLRAESEEDRDEWYEALKQYEVERVRDFVTLHRLNTLSMNNTDIELDVIKSNVSRDEDTAEEI